jgi:WD40 repeat protein
LTLPYGEQANQLAFSHDGRTLVSLDTQHGQVKVWDVATGHVVGEPEVPGITSMSLSPDTDMLALGYCSALEDAGSTCAGPAIQLWDIPSQRKIGPPLVAHTGFVTMLVMVDGNSLISAGNGDDLVLHWQVSDQSWLERACHIANRNLTRAEWKRFIGSAPYAKTCPDLPAGQ